MQGRQAGGRVSQVQQLAVSVQQLPGSQLLACSQVLCQGGGLIPADTRPLAVCLVTAVCSFK